MNEIPVNRQLGIVLNNDSDKNIKWIEVEIFGRSARNGQLCVVSWLWVLLIFFSCDKSCGLLNKNRLSSAHNWLKAINMRYTTWRLIEFLNLLLLLMYQTYH